LNGYQSVIDVWKDALTAKNVPMLTNSKVNKIRWQSADGKVTVNTEDGKTYVADHVIVTVSLGNFLHFYKNNFQMEYDNSPMAL
jgi:protoporphyrinogen oxidase